MIFNQTALLQAKPIKNMLAAKVDHNGVSHGLGEAGYDIRIKQEVIFDPGYDHTYPMTWDCDLASGVGRFCLASSMEEFDMPDRLVGIVHDKSTWARRGLSVFNTVIEPGWKGFLTLELVYHGNTPLHIPEGSGIAQVVFHQTVSRAVYDGKYQNQADEPVEAILR